MSARTYHAAEPDRVAPGDLGARVACHSCGASSACVYRCDECEADLVRDGDGSAGRIGGNR